MTTQALARRVALRLARSVFVVWLAMTIVFFAVHGVGDPAVATLGPRARPEQIAQFRERHGLDRPLAAQYGSFLAGMVTLDLGASWRDDRRVVDVIATRLPRTLLLMSLATLFELVIGLGLGLLAARRRGSWIDTVAMGASFLGVSTPSFFLGVLALQFLAFRLGWFPVGGFGVDGPDHLWHALLPALVLASLGAATYARLLRSEVIEVSAQDHVRTARAKGLSRRGVLVAHIVRNAMPPIVTMIGLSLPSLVAGAVVSESVFGWPGMGRLAMESIYSFDLPMLLGIVFVGAVTVQVGNLGAELVVARIDPRVRERSDP
ncbi:MAG: ABC transporter permease [Sandaracinaceae bacterium]|nr:ABC transporter permease [Sandaracinaceae bacterium]